MGFSLGFGAFFEVQVVSVVPRGTTWELDPEPNCSTWNMSLILSNWARFQFGAEMKNADLPANDP